MIASGTKVEEFESRFARWVGTREAVALSSGTPALQFALLAAGVGPGDEVITTPFTFIATANTILQTGATPVFADIDADTFNISPDAVKKSFTHRTKAILPVHLYGGPADMRALLELGSRYSIPVIEDACQAHGARVGTRAVGSLGQSGTFSFYPTKNMTTGEGGMLTTDDPAIAAMARSLRNHGRPGDVKTGYAHERVGYNARMTDIAAAIGLVQLGRIDGFNLARRRNAKLLDRLLEGIVTTPREHAGTTHVYHQFTIRAKHRDALKANLAEAGVASGIYYPNVLYEYPHLRPFARSCPAAEAAAREVLSLPIHPRLSEKDIESVATAVQAATQQTR